MADHAGKELFEVGEIDNNRIYKVRAPNPPRPIIPVLPFVTRKDYQNPENKLSLTDPQRHFLIEQDAHEIERSGTGKIVKIDDGKYSYYLGRPFYVLPEKDQSYIKKKIQNRKGVYDSESHTFVKESPSPQTIKLGSCAYCTKICYLNCTKCPAFYCNRRCQTADWEDHKNICGQPAGTVVVDIKTPEEEPKQKVKSIPLEAHLPPNGSNVFLVSVSKTNLVFVRSAAEEDLQIFLNAEQLIQREGKLQKPLKCIPERGDIVLVKFKDDRYNRAMVLNSDDPDKIAVIYVDFGNAEFRPLGDLLTASDKLRELPRTAIPIILKDVHDGFLTTVIRNAMYGYLNTQLKLSYDTPSSKDHLVVAELIDEKVGRSLNELITSYVPSSCEDISSIVYVDDLECLPLPVGENVKLLIMDNTTLHVGYVSCSIAPYARAMPLFHRDIQRYMSVVPSNSPYTPRIDEICLAKYELDGLWYRGRCLETVGDGHPTILFLDYGNINYVPIRHIKKYPEQFDFPVMTADCEVNNLSDEISPDNTAKLRSILKPGTEIICQKVQKTIDENNYKIYIDDILGEFL